LSILICPECKPKKVGNHNNKMQENIQPGTPKGATDQNGTPACNQHSNEYVHVYFAGRKLPWEITARHFKGKGGRGLLLYT
jgi:hypothetical protein